MPERIAKIIEMLEMVEVRRSQNHKLIVAAVESLRVLQEEIAKKGQAESCARMDAGENLDL